jgi:hypothetical protein
LRTRRPSYGVARSPFTERGEVTKFLREYKSVKREEFDLEQIYVPHPGPWLSVPSGPREKPDRVIVVLGPRLSAGRFALVQWDEHGFAVGGFTFEVLGKTKPPSTITRTRKSARKRKNT